MDTAEFIKISKGIIKAFITTPYRDELSDNSDGYYEIPKQYRYSGDLDKFNRIITKGSTIYDDNLHGNIFLLQNNGEYEYTADFSTVHNGIRYIITFYHNSIQIFKNNAKVPSDVDINYYLYSGYANNDRKNITILNNDSEEYLELLNIFAASIKTYAENRGLFRTITPEKISAVQKIADSDCFILLHSSKGEVVNSKVEKGFWNTWIELKQTMTYDLSCSQLKKINEERGKEPLTAEEIINYTYHPKGNPSTIIFAMPNAIFKGLDKFEDYEAIIDFKEYNPLFEKESKAANKLLHEIASMPDGEEKHNKQMDYERYYSIFDCSFVPKDLIAGILNSQGELWLNPEWIELQPNKDELISIHKQRVLDNIEAKEKANVKWYSYLAKRKRY
jgi:hypothetical protein